MESSNTSIPLKREEDPKHLKESLPNELWFDGKPIYLYQGFWASRFDFIYSFLNNFEAQDNDIFTTSFRKVGTTWLKALVFAIRNRENYEPSDHPLLNHNPHELVPQLESNIYAKSTSPDFSNFKSPRMFGTHVPFSALPSSMKDSKCKIIYIFRNPLDAFVSSWLFYQHVDGYKPNMKTDMLDLYFDMFCLGKVPFGPFPEHALGYWKASLERPEKVLFIKYEDLQADPRPVLKTMAVFLGCPFTDEEEVGGVIDDIVKLCSIRKLKEAVSTSDQVYPVISNEKFFRKGVVGDWINHLTPSMADKLEKIMEEKFGGSGLNFS